MSQTTPVQSMILTGLSTVVGLLFLTVAGKIVENVTNVLVADAVASADSETVTHFEMGLAQRSTSTMAQIAQNSTVSTAAILQEDIAVLSKVHADKALQQEADFGRLSQKSSNRRAETMYPSSYRDTLDLQGYGFTVSDLDFMGEGQPVKYMDGPKLHARSAIIVDLDSGEILWEKAADTRRPAASVTKVLAALTLGNKDVDLDREVCVDQRIRTGMNGAVTRVAVDDCATGWDFMGAALVSSDNGAAFAFPMVADEELFMFAHDMNQTAIDLGMTQSEFVDPAGIYDGNLSTARDLTRASIAAAFHPKVSIPAGANYWSANIGDSVKHYVTTNKAAGRTHFLLAKTGYTDTARANFTAVYEEKNGRRIAFTILGAWNVSRRTQDINRVIDWVRQH